MKKNNMRKEEIKRIMIVHNDNDFIRAWDWVGGVTLNTIMNGKNICNEELLEDSEDIEAFILSLLPTAVEFIQYRSDKYKEFVRYRDISKDELTQLVDYFKDVRFKYNFEETDEDWLFGGSETLIIDLENKSSYVR